MISLYKQMYDIDGGERIYRACGFVPQECKSICSPFRSESSASFSIYYYSKARKWLFKDLATENKGDGVVFYAQYHNLDTSEALTECLKLYGIERKSTGKANTYVPPLVAYVKQEPEIKPVVEQKEERTLYNTKHLQESFAKTSNFHKALMEFFPEVTISELQNLGVYGDGINTYFAALDNKSNVMSVKRIRYEGIKRDKAVMPFYLNEYKYNTDFPFCAGDITEKTKRVFVVESEKSALLVRLFWGVICVAVGGKTNLRRLESLPQCSDRLYYLLPDLDAWDEWRTKGIIVQRIGNFIFNKDLLSRHGEKSDIADVIVSLLHQRERTTEITKKLEVVNGVIAGSEQDTKQIQKQPDIEPVAEQPPTIEPPTDLTEAEEREILWEYETFIRFEPSDDPNDQPPELSEQAQKYLKILERERVSGYEHPEIWGRFAEIV